MTEQPRVLLSIPHPNWAFHHIAAQLMRHLSDEFKFRLVVSREVKNQDCDILVAFYWDDLPLVLSNNKAAVKILCLYDHFTWCSHEADAHRFKKAYAKSDILIVGNEPLSDWVRSRNDASTYTGEKPIFICEDGVDTEFFTEQPFPKIFTAGWCGNSSAGHGEIKGLDIIKEACKKANVPLEIADRANGTHVDYSLMSDWYSKHHVQINASSYEGTPNPPLEALASGRPVITTRCGIMPRVINHGFNGWFVERDADSIAEALIALREKEYSKLAKAARTTALAHSWEAKIPHWRNALRAASLML